MLNWIMNIFAIIIISIIVNAGLGLIINGILVVLLSILLGLVLVISINGIIRLEKNSIMIKAMMRAVNKEQFFQRVEVGVNPQNSFVEIT